MEIARVGEDIPKSRMFVDKFLMLSMSILLCGCEERDVNHKINISSGKGHIHSPNYPGCSSEKSISWIFNATIDHPIVVEFMDFDISSCTKARLTVEARGKRKTEFCEKTMPSILHSTTEISLNYDSKKSDCGRGIAFTYIFPRILVEIKSVGVVGEGVPIRIDIPDLPDEISNECQISFGTESKYFQMFQSGHSFNWTFNTAGEMRSTIECSLIVTSDGSDVGMINKDVYIAIQDNLTYIDFRRVFDQLSQSLSFQFGQKINVTLTLPFTYPFTYRLIFVSIQQSTSDGKINYTNDMMIFRTNLTLFLLVSSRVQITLGPGAHIAILLLENDVTTANHTFNILLCEKLKNLNIEPIRYIDLEPAPFSITIQIAEGSPAFIGANIRNKQDNRNVATTNAFCSNPQECKEVVLEMSVPFEGVFDIFVKANNSLGEVTSKVGPVESFPLVHRVYVTSTLPIFTTNDAMVFVFYELTSSGTFEIQVSVNDNVIAKKEVSYHITLKMIESELPKLRIPFDPAKYKVYNTSYLFTKPGPYNITAKVTTENHKQSLSDEVSVIVMSAVATVCLTKVKIQDGSAGSFMRSSLQAKSPIILSTDVHIECEIPGKDEIRYKWKIYKVDTMTTKPENEIHYKQLVTETNEIHIKPWMIDPGLYIIQVIVTQVGNSGILIQQVEDFTSIKIPRMELNAQICGGTLREIGHNTSQISFDGSCSLNPHIQDQQYDWFCSLNIEDLPVDKHIGMFQHKGSCFGWNPSFVGNQSKVEINVDETKIKDKFYIRLFVSLSGYEDVFTDQEVFILSHPAPSLNILCWVNCGKSLKPQEPFILQIQCDSCVSYEWKTIFGKLSDCDSREFCKIESAVLEKINSTKDIYITATGVDDIDQNASITIKTYIIQPPSAMQCSYQPESGFGFITRFNLTCITYERLIFKFSLIDEDSKSLLQYGYETEVTDLILPPGYIQIQAETCNSAGSCSHNIFPIQVQESKDPAITENWQQELENAIKSKNSQKVAQYASSLSKNPDFSMNLRNKMLNFALDSILISTESVKQTSDVLQVATEDYFKSLDKTIQGNLINKLSDVSTWIHNDIDSSIDSISSVVRKSLIVSSNIMEGMSETQVTTTSNHRTLTTIVDDLSREMLEAILPGDEIMKIKTRSVDTSIKRYKHSENLTLTDDEVQIKVEDSMGTQDDDTEFLNLQVFRFNSSNTKFNTKSNKADEVVGITLSKSHKIPGKIKSETKTFSLSKPIKYGLLNHQPEPEYFNLKLNETKPGLWSGFLPIVVEGSHENVALKIRIITNDILEMEKVKLTLQESNILEMDRFKLNEIVNGTEFASEGGFTWTIPILKGHSIFNLTVETQSIHAVTLKILTYATKCSFWDDMINDWNSDGCKATLTSTLDKWTWCECDPQTFSRTRKISSPNLFSSRLIVYPNKIDFTKVSWNLWEEFYDNPIIFLTVFGMYLVFGSALFWARWKDKNDIEFHSYIEVSDNLPNEHYRYLLTIFTGNRRRSGPSSTVVVKINGSNNKSVVHILQKCEEERILLQGSVITFLITTPGCLGDVTTVRLWHGNEGTSPEWYIDRLVVRDYETNECWFFLINTWLSDYHMGECQIDIEVHAATIKHLHSFKSLFTIKSENYLKDRHLWYSLFAMRPWSQHDMSRTQRVACCSILVFMLMLTSLMFYGLEASLSIDLGYYSFKWSNIAIGLESSILCFPATYIVSVIFRQSRQHHHRYNHSDTVNYDNITLTSTLSDFNYQCRISSRRFSRGTMTSSRRLLRHRELDNMDLSVPRFRHLKSKRHTGNSMTSPHRISYEKISSSDTKTQQSSKVLVVDDAREIQLTNSKNLKQKRRKTKQQIKYDGRELLLPSAGFHGDADLQEQKRSHHRSKVVTVMDIDPDSVDFKPIPWFCIYFAWILITIIIIGSSVLSVMYGMTYGSHISKQWLVSLLSGIIQNVFVLEPFKAIFLAYIIVVNNPRHDISDWIPPLRTEILPRRYKNPHHILQKLIKERETESAYKYPDVDKVKNQTIDKLEDRVFKRRIKDISVHLIYLAILLIIAYGLHDNKIIYFKTAVKNMFDGNSVLSKMKVKTRTDVYDWFKGPLIDSLYGGHSSHFPDKQLLVIGPPTLRQQRIKEGPSCVYTSVIPYLKTSSTCKSNVYEEIGKYSTAWFKYRPYETLTRYGRHHSPWTYVAGDPYSLPFLGEHDNYHLGGYVGKLTKNKNNATKMIQYLQDNNWIDDKTRIVMLETVLYNTAVRLFCIVLLGVEIPNTGQVHVTLQLMVMRSHHVVTSFDVIVFISLFALLAMVFYFIYNIVSLARETGFEYFADVWNVLEILTLITSVGAVITFLSKATYTDLALHATKTGDDNLFLFYTASCLDYALTCLLGYCIFFTMMRTVAIMEGHPHFRLSNATMQIIRFDLAGHLFCLFIGYMAFCHSGLIMFHDMLDFSSILRATQSIVAYAAGAYMNNLLAEHPMHGGIFLLIFLLIYVKLFVNFYACILENAYRESKLLLRDIKKGDFVHLTRKQIRSLFAIEARKRLKEEAKEKLENEKLREKILREMNEIEKERKSRTKLEKKNIDA
ncbi:polycystin family receptor for egg jelly-like isoform X2 [Styela clava]